MTAVAVLVGVLVAAVAWLAVQAATGGWRRILIRSEWHEILRRAGGVKRRGRDLDEPVDAAMPRLWGLFGRLVGPRGRPVGATWRVWAARGETIEDNVMPVAGGMASAGHCIQAIVERRGAKPRHGRVTFLWRDAFADARPWWPAEHGALRPAFNVLGDPVRLPILSSWGSSWLIGGVPGSGKSAWLNAMIADLVRQPAGSVRLLGVDLKRVELAPWAPAFDRVAFDRADAVQMVRRVRRFIDQRMAELAAAGLRHVPSMPTAEWPLVVLVVDEIAALLLGQSTEVRELTDDLAAIAMLGRAAGVVLIVAAQRPATDAVPGRVRDQVVQRVMCRPANLDHAEMILGDRPERSDVSRLIHPGMAIVRTPLVAAVPLARSTWGTPDDIHALLVERGFLTPAVHTPLIGAS